MSNFTRTTSQMQLSGIFHVEAVVWKRHSFDSKIVYIIRKNTMSTEINSQVLGQILFNFLCINILKIILFTAKVWNNRYFYSHWKDCPFVWIGHLVPKRDLPEVEENICLQFHRPPKAWETLDHVSNQASLTTTRAVELTEILTNGRTDVSVMVHIIIK